MEKGNSGNPFIKSGFT